MGSPATRHKVCARCGLAQDADAYAPSAATYDGLSAQCMRCVGGRHLPQRRARQPGGHRRLTVAERQVRQATRDARVVVQCGWCGVSVERTPLSQRSYCSRSCYDAAKVERDRVRAANRVAVDSRACPLCGAVFTVYDDWPGQVHCGRSCGRAAGWRRLAATRGEG